MVAGDLIDTPALSLESQRQKIILYCLTLVTFRNGLFLEIFLGGG